MDSFKSDISHPELQCGVDVWDAIRLGNHRIIVSVERESYAVIADIPWRRRDPEPEEVQIIVKSTTSGQRVKNVTRLISDRICGKIAFEPIDKNGEYEVYYLPYVWVDKIGYANAKHQPYWDTSDVPWREKLLADVASDSSIIPRATALRYEAVSERDSFAPMGFVASDREIARYAAKCEQQDVLLFLEDRTRPIEMTEYIPAHWIQSDPYSSFAGTARRGEYYAFQIGLYAMKDLDNAEVSVQFPFPVRSLATEGIQPNGSAFAGRKLKVAAGQIRPLWFVVEVPEDGGPGDYQGTVTVAGVSIAVALTVDSEEAPRGGTDEPELMTRLGWLDSRLGHNDEVVAPFEPIVLAERSLSILGRRIELDQSGLPAQIYSTFTADVTRADGVSRSLLSAPIEFGTGIDFTWEHAQPVLKRIGTGRVEWHQSGVADGMNLSVLGSLEADGCLEYQLEVRAGEHPVTSDGLSLQVPFNRDVARYIMGLGVEGRECPEEFFWQWNVASHNQDSLWVGDVNAGIQLSLRDDQYRRPLNSPYYRDLPLVEPISWGNNGQGSVEICSDECRRTVTAASGPVHIPEGGQLEFSFRVLLTPFKPISPRRQFSERYYHAPNRPEEISDDVEETPAWNDPGDPRAIKAYGASIINVHHATEIAPHINNPLITGDRLSSYVSTAHSLGMRVKVYDTVRELSTHTYETMALKSLDGEIFAKGDGGGHIWLQEHLGGDYIPGWFAPNVNDAAIITNGESRWHNYYVCALDRLAEDADLDGVYIDEAAFDRTVMKRIRKVLAKHRPDPLIDLQSAYQFIKSDGYVSSLNLFMEHLPYLDRLWMGEYIDYEEIDPIYWLIEVSGIPFGLMGEMLENGGNPWRGMIFGTTARAPRVDNRAMWSFWDSVGLADMRMVGWWAAKADIPVLTHHDDILATSWLGNDAAVVALASWAADDTEVELEFNLDALGFDADHLEIEWPYISGFQEATEVPSSRRISIPRNHGCILVVRPGR
ncbi:glycoside hydrolase domain-containing protein [Streptomyces sp. NPDC088190]|uniref:glycoside hydrolase domain-containing protein n=1 Tax=unclassified Streptomyces TaxID=2593676 RepID=UPI002E78B438|nr:glycoside hydrolase domain-containing protein [Streptomyces sp. JV190]MEE1838312.1 DUF6067 family protein [Streptomyces sp. JV190]